MQFRDLQKQYEVLKSNMDAKVQEVCATAHYISGAEVTELEQKLASYVGVKHCITCANGTDALTLALKAWGIGDGDAVFVPDFTFFSSGECPASVGATCFFVDVDKNTYNIDPVKLEEAIKKVIAEGKYSPRIWWGDRRKKKLFIRGYINNVFFPSETIRMLWRRRGGFYE